MCRETSLNLCKESPEMWTQALEAQQVAVTELLVVVLVEEALQVVATDLQGAGTKEGAQLAVVTELPLVAADP